MANIFVLNASHIFSLFNQLTIRTQIQMQDNQFQSIKCRDCGSQRKEIWTLPNWFWLRSSSPDNHWTEKWNTEPLHSDVQVLELAQGINDSLKEAGFHTVHSILKESPVDISNKPNLG
jgi:hypothetical protein